MVQRDFINLSVDKNLPWQNIQFLNRLFDRLVILWCALNHKCVVDHVGNYPKIARQPRRRESRFDPRLQIHCLLRRSICGWSICGWSICGWSICGWSICGWSICIRSRLRRRLRWGGIGTVQFREYALDVGRLCILYAIDVDAQTGTLCRLIELL